MTGSEKAAGTDVPNAACIAAQVRAMCALVASVDAASLSAEECTTLVPVLAKGANALTAASAVVAARAVSLGAHAEAGVADPALWLARVQGATTGEAKGALELARRLPDHPDTKDAVLSGDVSVGQAREVAAAATEHPALERELLEEARTGDLGALRSRVRAERLARMDAEALHRRRHEMRSLRHYQDRDGMICLRAALPPEVGVPFVTRLERHAERLGRKQPHDATGARRFDQRMADALVDLATGSDPGRRADRADLVIVCDLYAWRRGHVHGGEVCEVLGAGPIPVSVAKDFGRDAFVKAVLHDGVAVQLVKHFGRHLKAELRSALDLGPVPRFPGRACVDCGRRYGLERDHVDPVAHAGPTSVSNLADRCWPCHQDKTERDRRAGLLGPAPARRRARPQDGGSTRPPAGPSGPRGRPTAPP